jgi:hypothetical protein
MIQKYKELTQLAHMNEVKAQVKLRFRNVNGDEVVCTRSMVKD